MATDIVFEIYAMDKSLLDEMSCMWIGLVFHCWLPLGKRQEPTACVGLLSLVCYSFANIFHTPPHVSGRYYAFTLAVHPSLGP